MGKLRRYIVAGLLVWVPLGVTIFVVKLLVDLMDQSQRLIPPAWRPENLIGFHIPGLGVVLSVILVVGTGVIVANFFGRQLIAGWESLLARIPLVRSVYASSKQLAETVLADGSQSFKKVLLIEYPRKGLWGLAFQTSTDVGEVQARTAKDVICVFVPTTPNPTSGFLIMVARDEVIELEMRVDEALKMIISLGVVVPRWRKPPLDGQPPTIESAVRPKVAPPDSGP